MADDDGSGLRAASRIAEDNRAVYDALHIRSERVGRTIRTNLSARPSGVDLKDRLALIANVDIGMVFIDEDNPTAGPRPRARTRGAIGRLADGDNFTTLNGLTAGEEQSVEEGVYLGGPFRVECQVMEAGRC